MKYKIKLANVHVFEYQALENYLNIMAEKGWHIKRLRGYYMVFERKEKVCCYHVVLQSKFDKDFPTDENENIKEMQSFLEDFHYEYVCGFKMMQIFTSDVIDEKQEEDTIIEVIELSKKHDKPRFKFVAIFCIFNLCYLISIAMISSEFLLTILLSFSIWAMIALLVLIPIVVFIKEKRLREFYKAPYLERNPNVFDDKRSWIYIPIMVLLCVITYQFMFARASLICLLTGSIALYFIKKKWRKYCLGIWIVSLIGIIFMGDPYIFEIKPKQDALVKIEYESYQNGNSLLGSFERYIGEGNETVHYIIDDALLGIMKKHLDEETLDYVMQVSENEYWETTSKDIANQIEVALDK